LIVPRARDLHAGIARLRHLCQVARSHRRAGVLCHTDVWGSNLLLSGDGTLHLLDWNGATIAPPEHDLFMFAGTSFFPADRFGWFLDRYEATFRPTLLDADAFGFYLYRRTVEDFADFVDWIVEGRTEAMAASEALGFAAANLDDMSLLEARIHDVKHVLGRTRRAHARA
jgi:spectinomycin phosphotransferase